MIRASEPPDAEAVMVLLRSVGVGETTAARIATQACATPEYVKRHLRRCEIRDEPLRFALRRMLDGERPALCPVCGADIASRRTHGWVIDNDADGAVVPCPLSDVPDADLLPQVEVDEALAGGSYEPLRWRGQ